MKKHKLLACLLAGAMVLSMTACGEEAAPVSTEEPVASVEEKTEEPVSVYDDAASITFADGNFAFLGSDTTFNPAAKETVFSLADRNGQKAVKIESAGAGKLYAGIQMDALLGDKIGEVASVEFVIEAECGTSFIATSGNVVSYLGEDQAQNSSAWSIYLEKSPVKKVVYELPAQAMEGNRMVLTLEVNADSNSFDGEVPTALYLYSISFKDASGNVLAADTTAEYVAVSSGPDRTNLFGISDEILVNLAGSGDGWAQIGYQDLTEDEFAMLTTPGSVVEIEYTSETGNMWMGLSGNAWTRIGVGDCDGSGQGYSYYNNSKNIAQITYEDIASVCGDDASAWDKQIFLESDGKFEVFSVKIGMQAPSYVLTGGVDVSLSGKGDGWAQIGYDVVLSEEALNLLKTPGSMVAVEYASDSDDLWIGLSGEGWNRVGVGNADGSGSVDAICANGVCYVTYDMIASVCGEDSSAWDTTLFVESDSAFEVYSVKVGMAGEVPACRKQIDVGLSGTGDGWAQIGYDVVLPEEALNLLKTPGSVVAVQYAADTNDLWIGLSGEGWNRVGVGNADGSGTVDAICANGVCYVTYDMIASVCGEDASKWDGTLFVESDGKFEVFKTTIGTSK